jgi:hypothetical protein
MAFSLLFVSCKKSNNELNFIEFSSYECFGNCPVMDIKVLNDTLYVNFIKYNSRLGLYYKTLTSIEKDRLNKLVTKLKNNEVKDSYDGNVVDVGYYKMRICSGKFEANTSYSHGEAPKYIIDLYDFLFNISYTSKIKAIKKAMVFSTRGISYLDTLSMPPPPLAPDFEIEEIEIDRNN